LIDTNNSMLGGCKLVCLILGRYNTPQSLYLALKLKRKKKPMFNEDYMVTNEFIEFQWPRVNNSLTYMLEKTNINVTKKIQN
jgi:hypothetical protein